MINIKWYQIIIKIFVQVVERKNEHDWSRSARMSLIGGFLVGPTIRTWYLCLDKVCSSEIRMYYAWFKKTKSGQPNFLYHDINLSNKSEVIVFSIYLNDSWC